MNRIILFLLLSCSLQSFAQRIPTNPEKYARTITAADLSRHLYIIASREMEGRETGMPGERKAAAYIENEFRRIGLEPANNGSYQQYFNVYQDSLLGASLEVNGSSYQLDRDFNVYVATNIDATLRFSEVIFLNNGSLDSVKKMNLAGKLVMMNWAGNMNLTQEINRKGVAAIIYISEPSQRTRFASRKGVMTNSIYRRTLSPQQYLVSPDVARNIMQAAFDSINTNTSMVRTFPSRIVLRTSKMPMALETSNVLGMIRGTDLQDQYLVITAHHDHIGMRDTVINYGADDDGSGTVSIIELAEAFARAKAEGRGPRRTIIFMTVSGEEKGLWGSEYFAQNPAFPLERTTANLNIDMIGRIDPKRGKADSLNYVYVVGDDKLSSDLRPISESVNRRYTRLGLDYKFNDPADPMRIYYRSDHYNFAKNGVPIIFYFNGTHADYHRPTDTPDKINYTLMAKRAQFVFYTAWEMANRNEMLKRDLELK